MIPEEHTLIPVLQAYLTVILRPVQSNCGIRFLDSTCSSATNLCVDPRLIPPRPRSRSLPAIGARLALPPSERRDHKAHPPFRAPPPTRHTSQTSTASSLCLTLGAHLVPTSQICRRHCSKITGSSISIALTPTPPPTSMSAHSPRSSLRCQAPMCRRLPGRCASC